MFVPFTRFSHALSIFLSFSRNSFQLMPPPPFSFTFRHFPFCLFICAVESVVARESSKQPENAAYFLQLSTAYHFLRLFWYESTVQINSRPLSILRVCRIFFSMKPLEIYGRREKNYVFAIFFRSTAKPFLICALIQDGTNNLKMNQWIALAE